MFEASQLAVTAGVPARFESSPGTRRSFCSKCGTSLFFEADSLPGLVDVTVASLDEPNDVPPQMHIWDTHRLDWVQTRDSLPRFEALPPPDGG